MAQLIEDVVLDASAGVHRPRNLDWKRAAALLYGDWGTSKAYVISLAFVAAGFSSLPIILAVCALTGLVGINYNVPANRRDRSGGASSRINEQIDFFRQRVGYFADDVAAKQIHERAALWRAENDARCSERRGNIDNRLGSGGTHRIAEQRRDVLGFLFRFGENCAGFRVLLPFAPGILFCHERLFTHEEQVKTRPGPGCFSQREIEGTPCAANRAQDCFAL